MINLQLEQLVQDVATSIKRIDSRQPQATNARTGQPFQAGIGPHGERAVVQLVTEELVAFRPEPYRDLLHLGVSYPGLRRQQCDICIGQHPDWDWAVEVKMLRL